MSLIKQFKTVAVVGSIFLSTSLWGGNLDKKSDIIDTAVSAGGFETLVAALKAADLLTTLKGEGPFTVLAPTDEAFDKLPNGTLETLLKPENKSKLQAILTYHVAPGTMLANQVASSKSIKTVLGQNIAVEVNDDDVRLDNAKVIQADIRTSNGVIHVIDAVLIPRDIVDLTVSNGSFNTLAKALQAADLVETLKSDGPFTVFAPTDEAFAKLPSGTLESLLKPENKSKLQAILTYHVMPGKIMAKDMAKLSAAKTVNGQQIDIQKHYGHVLLNDIMVTQADIVATNGVIHVIDSVLLPE